MIEKQHYSSPAFSPSPASALKRDINICLIPYKYASNDQQPVSIVQGRIPHTMKSEFGNWSLRVGCWILDIQITYRRWGPALTTVPLLLLRCHQLDNFYAAADMRLNAEC
jgi:hypothetical protein